MQRDVICKIAEGALDPSVGVTDVDTKELQVLALTSKGHHSSLISAGVGLWDLRDDSIRVSS